MADDEENETEDDAVAEEVDDDAEIDDDEIDGEFEEDFAGDGEFADGEEDDEDDEEDDDKKAAAAKVAAEDDEDDEPDPDDVEEDLDVILKDRLASGDGLDEEEDDDEDQVVAPPITATEGDNVAPKREDEWTCHGCFLIVSARQFGKKESARCPSGVTDCPSIAKL